VQIPKLGNIQIDRAEFCPQWRLVNGGADAFCVVVAVSTGLLLVLPTNNKKTDTFKSVIETVCRGNLLPNVSALYSDRESALYSKKFQKFILDKYGVKLRFLSRFSKAWLAEVNIIQRCGNVS
jgi:hypothetical protein